MTYLSLGGMFLNQDQLCNLQGSKKNSSVGFLVKKQREGSFFFFFLLWTFSCCGIFYILFNAAHHWTWGYFQVEYRPVSRPLLGREGLSSHCRGAGSRLRTHSEKTREQDPQPPVHAPLSHQISWTKHRVMYKIIKNFKAVIAQY